MAQLGTRLLRVLAQNFLTRSPASAPQPTHPCPPPLCWPKPLPDRLHLTLPSTRFSLACPVPPKLLVVCLLIMHPPPRAGLLWPLSLPGGPFLRAPKF